MNDKSTFDIVFEGSPFLKGLVLDKIAEEVEKKNIEIVALQEELTLAKDRVTGTEDAINMILEVM